MITPCTFRGFEVITMSSACSDRRKAIMEQITSDNKSTAHPNSNCWCVAPMTSTVFGRKCPTMTVSTIKTKLKRTHARSGVPAT